MKAYMKGDDVVTILRRAGLAALLLCLPLWASAQETAGITTTTRDTMNMTEISPSAIPEGYSPLPVTEFVVDAEKNDTYILSFGVQDNAIDQNQWILTKYIRGNLLVYDTVNKQVLYSISIPVDHKLPMAGFMTPYNKVIFQGFFYYLKLKKGQYIIHPDLYIMNNERMTPEILLSFRRKKFVW